MSERIQLDHAAMHGVGRRLTESSEPLRAAADRLAGTSFGGHGIGDGLASHGHDYAAGMRRVAETLTHLADEADRLGAALIAARGATMQADDDASQALRAAERSAR